MPRPLVSVITGTWQRQSLMLESIQNIRESSYRPLEHVIVSDGQDPLLRERIEAVRDDEDVPIVFVELGLNWSSFLAASMGAVPCQVAQWLARGEALLWATDDDRFDPDHVESLVDLLEQTDSDFVYSRSRVWRVGTTPREHAVIGNDPPVIGATINVLYRRELLDYRGFRTHVGAGSDHDQMLYWPEVGARWAMLDRATMEHRADKLDGGEGPGYRDMRQPLRGQTSDAQRAL